MQAMFPGIPNSPSTTLSNDITNSQTTITVTDPSKLPSAPNEATIGTGEDAETILYTGKSGNDLIGCTRGFEGTAKAWVGGTSIGRNFTNYDYSAIVFNLLEHINDDAEHGDFYRQSIINGGCQVAQDSAKTLSTTPQYGSVDMFSVKAGGTVGAGSITQVTNSTVGATGYALAITGVTLTGSGILYARYRMEAKDAVKLKNKIVSFACEVYHDVGSNINYTIYLRKPTVNDNYTGVTEISNSDAISVPSGIATMIKYENITLGDISLGLEIEIVVSCSAVTSKNFHFTDFQLNKDDVALVFVSKNFSDQLLKCMRYFETTFDYGQTIGALDPKGLVVVSCDNVGYIAGTQFKVKKRIAPTVTLYSATSSTPNKVRIASNGVEIVATVTAANFGQIGFGSVNGSGFTAGILYNYHYVSDARL